MELDISRHPHRRFNPLIGEWLLVSPHRSQRPWRGQQEAAPVQRLRAYDPQCYLCPGNRRSNGTINPRYNGPFVFDNDFPALLDGDVEDGAKHPLFQSEAIQGLCRVVCFSPSHDRTLPELSTREIQGVINIWSQQAEELGQRYRWVQIFENKGTVMGCSNPHPHGQIWAADRVPETPLKEDYQQALYTQTHGRLMLLEYAEMEAAQEERVVAGNDHWLAVVPYWAIWPYEILLLPRRPVRRLPELDSEEQASLAVMLKIMLTKYDNLFKTSFPYTMGWHGAPFDWEEDHHWQLHAHFYPPLLRSASVRKFMVGYEMLAEAQRDITAEQAAAALRQQPEVHFKDAR